MIPYVLSQSSSVLTKLADYKVKPADAGVIVQEEFLGDKYVWRVNKPVILNNKPMMLIVDLQSGDKNSSCCLTLLRLELVKRNWSLPSDS